MVRMTLLFQLFTFLLLNAQESFIRVNQLGYLPGDKKVAVMLSNGKTNPSSFKLVNAFTGVAAFESNALRPSVPYGSFAKTYRLDFSKLKTAGRYYILCGNAQSPQFSIGKHVYEGTADFLLNYMRQQRCGYNPFLKDSCHVHDGFSIYHPTKDSQYMNAIGGWHDASDYLQYVTTSANAVYQMLFAYKCYPGSFADKFDADGNAGGNGIPDVLDEAKWGLDWLVRMNPAPGEMYNQIADDRDHRGFRLPTLDTTSYGRGLERPVYFVTGKPQGMFKYKNRTTGVASTAGKYASSFSLGAEMLKKYYPDFASTLLQKSIEAYAFGKKYPGICQTAPCVSPYFYEEDNYTDDMELAAAQLAKTTGGKELYKEADAYGKTEMVTPWMGADTARHYQWYPFLNLGHYLLAKNAPDAKMRKLFSGFLKLGLERIRERGKDAFLFGVPFIWCSNNLVAAAITQAHLYRQLTGDGQFTGMEFALRDWLFGCNPWGTSMIYGLPKDGDYPADPHSALSHNNNFPLDGGLVDGPVYTAIYKRLLGIKLSHEDTYKAFQSDVAVYHDDYGDYSTNEPTMDGTASLSYYFAAMQNDGGKVMPENVQLSHGAVVRMDTTKKQIYLCFTGHEFADGAAHIIKALHDNKVKASFFFTGDFYRNPAFTAAIKSLKKAGHYLGAHSDKHLLYCDWTKRDSLLIDREAFMKDVHDNYQALEKFGIQISDAPYFLPAYEWYNSTISRWTSDMGLQLVNMSPATYTNADYTIPSMGKSYKSSGDILQAVWNKENESGLNGSLLLIHFGTHPERTDKLYLHLDAMLKKFKAKGYSFAVLS
ncbi:MAG: glycoside hydrolase family 9 protein [Ignavibacteriales bacterium]|nr:glycoside hydrolase family 9 protein [Ignavibacteriales bacterium]